MGGITGGKSSGHDIPQGVRKGKEVLLSDCRNCVHHRGTKHNDESVVCGRVGFASLNVNVMPRAGDAKPAVHCNFYEEK